MGLNSNSNTVPSNGGYSDRVTPLAHLLLEKHRTHTMCSRMSDSLGCQMSDPLAHTWDLIVRLGAGAKP